MSYQNQRCYTWKVGYEIHFTKGASRSGWTFIFLTVAAGSSTGIGHPVTPCSAVGHPPPQCSSSSSSSFFFFLLQLSSCTAMTVILLNHPALTKPLSAFSLTQPCWSAQTRLKKRGNESFTGLKSEGENMPFWSWKLALPPPWSGDGKLKRMSFYPT